VRLAPITLATRACRQSSYIRPVRAATKPVILIMSSLATEIPAPFPQIDIIGAMVNVWRVRGENYQGCSVQYCAQQLCTVQFTHVNGPNSSLEWVLSHWVHFTVLRFIFTARRSYASAVLGVVILSVCRSHACFVTNPKNLPAIFLYHMKGQSF